MIGETIKILGFLSTPMTQFVIPLYQRNYDWKEENCKQLFEDIVRVAKQPQDHFFGSIVSRLENLASHNVLIIDGQQRLTTVTLLLKALVDAHSDGKIDSQDPRLDSMIPARFIEEEYLTSSRKYKLCPIEKDQIALDALLDNKKSVEGSNLTRNYRLFYRWICESGLSMDALFSAISSLTIINIKLEDKDDPQLIFESINSTGLGLSEADKIRNFFLMSLSAEQQKEYYKHYWNRIEEATDYEPTMFMRDFLTIKTKKISKIDELYHDFKRYILDNAFDRCEVLKEMLPYAIKYHMAANSDMGDNKLDKKMRQLRTLNSPVDMPFYMAFLKYADEEHLSNDIVYSVLDIVENYWARRILCNLPSNALNKVFSTLHSDIIRLIEKQKQLRPDENINYLEVMKYVLLHKQGTAEWPEDKKLAEEFHQRQVYRIPSDYRMFLFERMENKNGKEWTDVVKGMKDGSITIEHIMPQTLNPQWVADLGDNAEEVHEEYKHTFANLTLTGYNSNYSNRPFSEKKSGYEDAEGNHVCGFDESAYRLSSYVKKCDKWTLTELQEREKLLYADFIKLWPEMSSDFKPAENTDSAIFDPEDKDAQTGRAIIGYSLGEFSQPCKSWKDMLLGVCSIMYKNHTTEVIELCRKNEFFHYWPEGCQNKDCTQFARDCYVWSSNSTYSKMSALQKIFDACGEDYANLEFSLRPLGEAAPVEDDAPERYKLRYDFWTEFLAYDKEHAARFINNNPTTDNWLARQIDGANCCVVANYQNSRVEIFINMGKGPEYNKMVFDTLYEHKAEIEQSIGEPLQWDRMEGKNCARIFIARDITFTEPSQRQQVMDFLSIYADKFLTAFVPQFGVFKPKDAQLEFNL